MLDIGRGNKVNTQRINNIKLNFGLVLFLLGIFLSSFTTNASGNKFYDCMTEIHLANAQWLWGQETVTVEVSKEELVTAQCIINFVGDEWNKVYKNGIIVLEWGLPEGASVLEETDQISAIVDGKQLNVGNIEITGARITISIDDDYQQLMQTGYSVEFTLKLVLKFKEGEYNLGDKLLVKAVNSGGSKASWSYNSVLINNIDAQDDTKLLGDAYFQIYECDYKNDAYEIEHPMLYNLTQHHVNNNGTFVLDENGFTTIEDTVALIEEGFDPGKVYILKEITPPLGYLPATEDVKFAFYIYTGKEPSGAANRYSVENEDYEKQYNSVEGIAIFGNKQAYGELKVPNIYVRNTKVPKLQVMKLDASTGDVMEGVEFTLQIQANQTGYSVDEYRNIENSGWEYDEATGFIQWTMVTKDGIISYPEGTVPYSTGMYELVEKVPEGYEGYGGSKTTRFQVKMKEDGTVEVVTDTGVAETVDGVNTIKILNQPVGDIQILKVDEAGKSLKGAEFAIYGTSERNTDDIIEKMGKKYYKLQEATTEKDGTATFTGLPYGVYYLVEKKAPQGYKILKDSHKIEVSKDILKDGVYTVKITNKKQGTPIIDTGGKGIFKNILIGVVLLMVGSFFFLLALRLEKKRRRAKRRAQAARRRANGQIPQRRRKPQRKNRR